MNEYGCKDSVWHSITIHTAVSVSAGADVFICKGSTATLNATGTNIFTYQWYQNGLIISAATNANYVGASYGIYYVIATSVDGCSKKSNDVHVYYKADPLAKIKLNGDNNIVCLSSGGKYVSFYNAVSEMGASYTWSVTGPAGFSATTAGGAATLILLIVAPFGAFRKLMTGTAPGNPISSGVKPS